MSCACCDEITAQMREWRERAAKAESDLSRARGCIDMRDRWLDNARSENLDLGRRNAALRGVITKLKRAQEEKGA